ncbi:esterase/lipase family protein [Rhodopseudomonas palustris]|nr:hypothetical protein [Rhodopseudomonas palustris]QLH72829.1 hypothetical protein HZF03_19305 [Rhodopseudomonas palustris]RHZ99891.1 hypothetical protein D1920_14580 [Rhodopseudomonas palustris]
MANTFTLARVSARTGIADAIYVHGLCGHLETTWTSTQSRDPLGGFWPKWICEDVPTLNVYTLGYPTDILESWAKKEMSLYERSKSILHYLASYNFGERQIAFVTHSLGGLLIKQVIRTGLESSNPAWKKIAESIRLVIFLATPHSGSGTASALSYFLPRLSSKYIKLLRSGSDELDQLRTNYQRTANSLGIVTASYYETHRTKNFGIIVDRLSADPGTADSETIPVDADHIGICKPLDRNQPVYLGISKLLREFTIAEHASTNEIAAPSKVRAERLYFSIFDQPTTNDFYFVLPFDGATAFSIPLVFCIHSSSPKSIKNVFMTLEMLNFFYQAQVGRTFDRLAEAREIRMVTDRGDKEGIARVSYKIPSLPPHTQFTIRDYIFAKRSTVYSGTHPVTFKDGVSARLETAMTFSIPVTITLDGEDIVPFSTTLKFHFREGDITDFRNVKRRENELLGQTKEKTPRVATFIGFNDFIEHTGEVGSRIREADIDSVVMKIARITPRGIEEIN